MKQDVKDTSVGSESCCMFVGTRAREGNVLTNSRRPLWLRQSDQRDWWAMMFHSARECGIWGGDHSGAAKTW